VTVARPRRVVLATANPHKADELRSVLAAAGLVPETLELLDRPDDLPEVPETGDTLSANAAAKAHAVADATGLPALADDTGLEVDALGGAPGVRTARYAGPAATDADNVARLLAELDGVPPERRTARFVTVLVLAEPPVADGTRPPDVVVRGEVTGRIAEAPRGRGGFGYDPVFVPDGGDGRTFAEMPPADKDRISHRARAGAALAAALRDAEDPADPRGG
jgi:XTP/dITP diphosphohydrolase